MTFPLPRWRAAAFVSALALSGWALAGNTSGGKPPVEPLWPSADVSSPTHGLATVPPSAEAASLLSAISDHAHWPTFAESARPKRSLAHHSLFVRVFHNEVVTPAIASGKLPLPDGSILVKENRFTPDGPLVLLTVMAKREGRWFWLEATPDGRVVHAKGRAIEGFGVPSCAGCHAQNADNDDVYTHDFGGD